MEPSALPDLCAESSLRSPRTDHAPGKPERVVAWRVPLESARIGFGFQSPPRYHGERFLSAAPPCSVGLPVPPRPGFPEPVLRKFRREGHRCLPSMRSRPFCGRQHVRCVPEPEGPKFRVCAALAHPLPRIAGRSSPLPNSWNPPRDPAVVFHRGERHSATTALAVISGATSKGVIQGSTDFVVPMIRCHRRFT